VFDAPTKAWKNIDGGLSKVDIYENPATGTFRVVGMSLKVAGNVREILIIYLIVFADFRKC
jgi:hypothetical protein